MKNLKVIFMGTPEFAVPVLEALIKNTNVVMVVTQPDKYVGRKQELTYSPIKEVANCHNIPVFQPAKIREDYETLVNMNADIIITCAYGQIIPKILLECCPLKAINVHASLLPKLRGGAPIHHAILDNYQETGITIMYMAEKMDDGDIISQVKTKITDNDTVGSLHDRLMFMAPPLLIDTLPSIIDGTNNRIIQKETEVTFGLNIKREEERINFNRSAREIFNQIRGLNPFPTANILINNMEYKVLNASYEIKNINEPNGKIINVSKDTIDIKCNDGIIKICEIKPFGKKKMLVRDYLNGIKDNSLLGVIVNEES